VAREANSAAWLVSVAADVNAMIQWISEVAAADVVYKNAEGDAYVSWVASEASAHADLIRAEADASKDWAEAEADAEKAWKIAIAAAEGQYANELADAQAEYAKAVSDAVHAFVSAYWPLVVARVSAVAPAEAAATAAVWAAHASYAIATAAAAVAQQSSLGAAQIVYVTSERDVMKTYHVTMAGIHADQELASAVQELANLQAATSEFFASIEPTPPTSWLDVAIGVATAIGYGLAMIAVAAGTIWVLSTVFFVGCPILIVGGLALAVAGVAAASLYRYADGGSAGDSVLGGLADEFGVSSAYAAATGNDIISGQSLNMTPQERGAAAGNAIVEIAGALGGRLGRWLCFVAGTNILMADDDASAQADAEELEEASAVFANIQDLLGDWRVQAAIGCLGTAAISRIARRSQRNREYEALELSEENGHEARDSIWGIETIASELALGEARAPLSLVA